MRRITGTDAFNMMEAYNAVYETQEITEEQVQEDFENWVNSLVEEGYDLSEFTWEDMYEEYITEIGVNFGGQAAVDKARSQQRAKQASDTKLAALRQQRFGSGGAPSASGGARTKSELIGSKKPQASPKPTPQRRGLGNISPSEGTGIGGPSDVARRYGRDTTSYQAGGGARSGRSVQATMQQGRVNLGRMDQGRPAPASARPTSGPSAVNPKSGVAGFPAAKPSTTTPATKPVAGGTMNKPSAPVKTTVDGSATGKPSTTTPAVAPAKKPSLASQAAELRAMQAASRQRQGLSQSFDMFDLVKGYLIDEGYAETEEAALQIMANMSEEWKQSIMEGPGGMMMSAASQGKGQVTIKKPAPQSAGGLTPMQRLQRKPDITIK